LPIAEPTAAGLSPPIAECRTNRCRLVLPTAAGLSPPTAESTASNTTTTTVIVVTTAFGYTSATASVGANVGVVAIAATKKK
jgi:hypothetical protein